MLRATDCMLRATDCMLRATDCMLRATDCMLIAPRMPDTIRPPSPPCMHALSTAPRPLPHRYYNTPEPPSHPNPSLAGQTPTNLLRAAGYTYVETRDELLATALGAAVTKRSTKPLLGLLSDSNMPLRGPPWHACAHHDALTPHRSL